MYHLPAWVKTCEGPEVISEVGPRDSARSFSRFTRLTLPVLREHMRLYECFNEVCAKKFTGTRTLYVDFNSEPGRLILILIGAACTSRPVLESTDVTYAVGSSRFQNIEHVATLLS